jgi:L-ribulose-5-phosphate 3-epimerase
MKDYWIGLYEKAMPNALTLEQKLLCAKEHNYDYVELSIDEGEEKLSRLDWTDRERDEVLKLIRKTDMPIHSICLSGHRKYPLGSNDSTVRERSLEIMDKAILLAYDLGIRIIQLAGYDVYYEESNVKSKEYFLKNLKRSVDSAARHGVVLAFETMETEFMNNVEKAMKYVKLVNSPYLQVYPDIGNCTNAAHSYRDSVINDLKLGEGHIAAMHLKETKPGKFREIPYGTGHVNYVEAINFAYSSGVRNFVTEFWYIDGMDYNEEIRKSKRFIDKKFKEALVGGI